MMKENIPIHKTFEFALQNLTKEGLYQQAMISKNIVSLNYIDNILDRNSKEFSNKIMNSIANEVNNHTAVVDIMSLSAFVYKGTERGLHVQPLIDAMNEQGGWLIKEQRKEMSNK